MTPRTRHRVWTSIGILTGVLLLGAVLVVAASWKVLRSDGGPGDTTS